MSLATVAALLLLTAALATDLTKKTIPNRLTIPFFAAGILFHVLANGIAGAGTAAWGAAAGFLPFLLLYLLGGIGAGDVKLFGAAGAWIGAAAVLQLMMASIVYAGLIGLILLAARRFASGAIGRLIDSLIVHPGGEINRSGANRGLIKRSGASKRMPFMIAVAPAVVTIWPIFP
ncbi:prepilin peptidase [Paenibacillus sp. LHD-117]|uniref:prepilin peptidase n=1 Tax=Paenibacillus sp. LHD-117 TaxID=3071412 RepID=UPI0027DEE62F|nr:prepilin peptidase [Paenibacillus sp. LHD-117]MDQ6420328.1 prepilin peptidase [Paenibacillus sp. LHD-117]